MSVRLHIHRFDTKVTAWIKHFFGPSVRPLFLLITSLGDPLAVGTVVVGLGYVWLQANDSRYGIAAAAILITVLVGAGLKTLVERARPENEYSATLATFSFPSGHSNGSAVTYGLLAILLMPLLTGGWQFVLFGLLVLPILIGISRVYLGAHYPSDVVAGWLLGVIGVLVAITLM